MTKYILKCKCDSTDFNYTKEVNIYTCKRCNTDHTLTDLSYILSEVAPETNESIEMKELLQRVYTEFMAGNTIRTNKDLINDIEKVLYKRD